MLRRFFKRLLVPPLIVLAAMIMFFEEWLWNRLVVLTRWLARARVFRWIEQRLKTLPPYGAMAVFLIPVVLLFPVKLAALYLITQGHAWVGVLTILAAKLVGTAIVARLFTVCRPALLSVPWFKRLFDAILRTRNWLYAKIKSMPGWKLAVQWKNAIKARLPRRGYVHRLWKAIGQVVRRKFHGKRSTAHSTNSTPAAVPASGAPAGTATPAPAGTSRPD